jgi:hypothetical protein
VALKASDRIDRNSFHRFTILSGGLGQISIRRQRFAAQSAVR